MARSGRCPLLPLALLAALAAWAGAPAFVPAPRGVPGAALAAGAAGAVPFAAYAEVIDVPEVGSSVGLAGLYEPIMLGIVLCLDGPHSDCHHPPGPPGGGLAAVQEGPHPRTLKMPVARRLGSFIL
ncbi:unnamed protein product [Prorocentrum cordatum]|uniref:Uncharacterized protein n=1 Tax=Prorocentrum cordatum TaxID=2364126 RepID=A0ABN9VWF2_9DINO|nr:unnamed protein product [Polarella glacialis]